MGTVAIEQCPQSTMRRLFTAVALIVLFAEPSLGAESQGVSKQGTRTQIMEERAYAEARDRKERSEGVLRAEGVPLNEHLPAIESESEVQRRSVDEIAYCALALLVVAANGEGVGKPLVDRLVKDYGLEGRFTPKEKAFLQATSPSERDRVQFTWRYEAAWVLLWALGYVDKLEKPVGICDVPRAVQIVQRRTAKQFVADAKLRSLSEILDQADRIYRYHWAIVEARVNGKAPPAELEPGVTLERHHALNWLVGYMGQEWDDIATDT